MRATWTTKGEVPIYVFRELREAWNGETVQDNPDFHRNLVSRELVNAHDGLVKGVFRLDNVVVCGRRIGVQGDTKHESGMLGLHKLPGKCLPRVQSPIREHVHVGVR